MMTIRFNGSLKDFVKQFKVSLFTISINYDNILLIQ